MTHPETNSTAHRATWASLALVALSITACGESGESDSEKQRGRMTFAVRYLNDYVVEQYPKRDQVKCMDEQPYDLIRSNGPSSIVRESSDDTILVEPADRNLPHLRFKNTGNDKPLKPADATTQSTLTEYGCNWQSYED